MYECEARISVSSLPVRFPFPPGKALSSFHALALLASDRMTEGAVALLASGLGPYMTNESRVARSAQDDKRARDTAVFSKTKPLPLAAIILPVATKVQG